MLTIHQLANRVDLRTLVLFLTVVETRNLTEAAVRENLVVSAVSRRMSRLEEAFGTRLLERGRAGVVPTAAGMELAGQVRRLVELVGEIQGSLDQHRTGVRGQVRLHAHTSALLDRLPEHLASFMREHPGVDVQLEEWDSARVVRNVREGRAHIGVFSSYVRASGLDVSPFSATRLILVCASDHPLASRSSIGFSETLVHDYVGLQDGDTFSALLQHVQGIARKLPAPMRVRIKAASVGALCRLVEQGVGIAILPATSAAIFSGPMSLALVPLRDRWASIRHDVCVREDAELLPAVRLLAGRLRASGRERCPAASRACRGR